MAVLASTEPVMAPAPHWLGYATAAVFVLVVFGAFAWGKWQRRRSGQQSRR